MRKLLFTLMMLVPIGMWAQTDYGITVGGEAVTSENASNITGNNIEAYSAGEPYSVSYDVTSNTLTLDNARITSDGITSDGNLNVVLNSSVVSRGINCGGDLSISTIGTSIVFYPVKSTKGGGATLTLQHGSDADAKLTLNYQSSPTGFNAVVYDGMYLSPNAQDNPRDVKFIPSRQCYGDNQGNDASTIVFTNAKTYELWLGATKVTESNKTNILGTDEPTATFDPDENLLTLNGMTLIGTDIYSDGIISRLPNLTISVNGNNIITCSDSCSVIRADMEGEQTLTIQKGSDGSSLTFDGNPAIRDFNTLTVTGLSWNESYTYKYDNTLPNYGAGYRLMKADAQEAGKNYATGFKPALYDENVEIYDLWVAGVQVTSANADNIQGKYINGEVSFDATKNILTMKRTTINLNNVYMGIPVASGIAALTVNLVDENTVTPNYNAQYFAKYTGEATDPTLTFTTEGYMDDGIYWLGELWIKGGYDLTADGYSITNTFEELQEPYVDPTSANSLTTGWKYAVDPGGEGNRYWKLEAFDLWIGDGRVISSNIRGGKTNVPYYNPITDRLVCTENCEYPIKSSMSALTVEIDGECTIAPTSSSAAISFQEKGEVTTGSLTFVKADGVESASITLTANGENNSAEPYKAIEGFSADKINLGEGLYLKSHATMAEALEATSVTIGDPTKYDLTVGGVQVTSANADDVLGDGTVSFTQVIGQTQEIINILTLTGATLTQPVKVGLANLTFDIHGTNTITTDETCIQNTATTVVPSLTFKSTSDEVGNLIMTNNNENGGISEIGEGNISISKELAVLLTVYGTDDYTSRLYYITDGSTTVAKIVPSYGVSIDKDASGKTDIYAGNAADVFGDGTVSFDKATSTLTLKGADRGALSTSLAELTIELVGDNTLTEGNYPVLRSSYGDAVTIEIKSTAEVKGSLTMNMSNTEAGNFCDDNVTLNITPPLSVIAGSLTGNHENDNTVVIGVSYGITINTATAGIAITNMNRTNVLNDPKDAETVQFDGIKTLILNNANLSSIQLTADNIGAKTGLTIYLKGVNAIANGTNNGVIYGGDRMPLTFATGDGSTTALQPGTLTCSVADPDATADALFGEKLAITYNNNLTATSENYTATITAAMIPLVTEEQKEQINEGEGKGLGEEIKDYIDQNLSGLSDAEVTGAFGQGIIINKILYVLPDDNDGYLIMGDDNVLCLNSQMSDGTVEEVAQKLYDGDIIPGSEDFKNSFHGLCFLLPAGEGEIVLDVNTGTTGELHVMVGIDEPVTITGKTEFETVTIPYLVDADTYVLIYSTANVVDASRVFDSHRAPGKKMMNTTTLKKVGVSARSVCSAPEPPVSPKMLTKSDMVAPILYGGQYTNFDMVRVEDTDVASIADDAFEGLTDVTCVDLSATGITGLTIDRDIKPWNYLPYSAFIYLPTGNKVKEGQQNVVIGDVCMNAELLEDNPFEITKDFTAKNIELKRDFKKLEGKKCTIMLPFALDETTAAKLGTFYEMVDGGASDANDGKVHMETVAETIANWPYMFKPADIDFINLDMVKVEAATEAPEYIINGMTFKGCFEKTTIESNGSANYYCFVKDQFVRVIDNSVTVKTFRAYMTADAGAGSFSNTLDIDWGDGTTSIKNMKVGTDNNIYYDLQGRRVLYPQKGVYILNGKKVVIK